MSKRGKLFVCLNCKRRLGTILSQPNSGPILQVESDIDVLDNETERTAMFLKCPNCGRVTKWSDGATPKQLAKTFNKSHNSPTKQRRDFERLQRRLERGDSL